jgi:hypothetical protein
VAPDEASLAVAERRGRYTWPAIFTEAFSIQVTLPSVIRVELPPCLIARVYVVIELFTLWEAAFRPGLSNFGGVKCLIAITVWMWRS